MDVQYTNGAGCFVTTSEYIRQEIKNVKRMLVPVLYFQFNAFKKYILRRIYFLMFTHLAIVL